MARKISRPVNAGSGDVVAYVTKPLRKGGEEVRAARCPQNQVFSRENVAISAKGCTEEEAKRKIYKELIKRARKLRQDMQVGACTGDCDAGDCILTTPIGPDELNCVPADMADCKDGVGVVCTFIGKVRAECVCAI